MRVFSKCFCDKTRVFVVAWDWEIVRELSFWRAEGFKCKWKSKVERTGGQSGGNGDRGGAELARNFPFVLLKPFLTNNIAVPSHFPPTNYLPNNSFSHKLLKSLVNENEVK